MHQNAGFLIPTDFAICAQNSSEQMLKRWYISLTLMHSSILIFDGITAATGKQEKQMGSGLMDVDGYCFLLISPG